MSLATRCSACGTVFRVVQDQLKVSEGWVRCGRCQEVFNALESLFDLDRPASAPAPLGGSAGASVSGQVPLDAFAAARVEIPPPAAEAGAEPEDAVVESRSSPSGFADADGERPPAPGAASANDDVDGSDGADSRDFADARFNTALLADDEAAAAAAEASAQPADGDAPHADATPAAPGFVRDAEREARWREPRVRGALMLSVAVLALLLAGQFALQFRDDLAARWPALRAPLSALCGVTGCSIGPPHRLDVVSVESSTLAQSATGSDAYRFSLVLRNRAGFSVAAPSVELSLTDFNGRLVVRRVFAPADFAEAPKALDALGETPLHLLLAGVGGISGYTIEIFYP